MAKNESIVFKNATIITYEEDTKSLKTLRNASLLVEAGRITQLAEGSLSNVPQAAEVVDATGKIISPGFIDTHHHMWQSALRTLGSNTTLLEYLSGRYSQTGPAGKHFTTEDVYLGQMASALEMIDSGTTTVLDHAHAAFTDDHVDAAVRASFECGLRIFYAHNIQPLETTGYTAEQGTLKLLDLAKDPRFRDTTNPVELGVAYDAWAFVPPEVNAQFVDLIIKHNNNAATEATTPISVLTTHLVGGPYGVGNSPSCLDSLPVSALSQPTLETSSKIPVVFSHVSFMTDDDANLVRRHPHVSISTTPESETHYGHTSIGADLCQDCASLGVDTHFTFSTYMPSQARLWLQLLRDQHYRKVTRDDGDVPMNNPMSCEAAFLLMTQKGGESLGRTDLGVIQIGAQADLVMFDTKSRPALWGARDPVAAVVLHTGGGGDVEAVMVQGKWLKKDHRIHNLVGSHGEIAAESVRIRVEESASRIQNIWQDLEPVMFKEGEKSFMGANFGKCTTIDVTRSD